MEPLHTSGLALPSRVYAAVDFHRVDNGALYLSAVLVRARLRAALAETYRPRIARLAGGTKRSSGQESRSSGSDNARQVAPTRVSADVGAYSKRLVTDPFSKIS
ncbi:MAG: hypothetical protein E7K68_05735, partial [Corynebacterium kroppenstedtii]|nr:hypothetical protein [Corynebacterium kroppenstedtii]